MDPSFCLFINHSNNSFSLSLSELYLLNISPTCVLLHLHRCCLDLRFGHLSLRLSPWSTPKPNPLFSQWLQPSALGPKSDTCISYFSWCQDKEICQKQFKEERVYLAHSFKVQSSTTGKTWRHHRGSWSHCICILKQRVMNADTQLIFSFKVFPMV